MRPSMACTCAFILRTPIDSASSRRSFMSFTWRERGEGGGGRERGGGGERPGEREGRGQFYNHVPMILKLNYWSVGLRKVQEQSIGYHTQT